MRRRKTRTTSLLVLAAFAALTVLAFGGAPASAVDGLHPLRVTAETSIVCHWTVDKSGPTHLTIHADQDFGVDYTVTVTKSCTNHVHGTVDGDGAPDSVDVTLDSTTAAVDCAPLDGSFHCTYDGHPSSTADGTVHAVAHYHDGSTASGDAPYSFLHAPVIDDSVRVEDSFAGILAQHLDHSAQFRYTRHISSHDCGSHFTIENTASVFDGELLASVTHTLSVDVVCGCTLTPGYWKTHSKYGPAPSDARWNLITPSGPDTPFFSSGQTYIQVLNTPPSGGNVYYILSFQYIAAKLNMLSGASSTPAVDSAFASATAFFGSYTPTTAGALGKSSTARQDALGWATTLGDYNSGLIGPGHCDEDHTSS